MKIVKSLTEIGDGFSCAMAVGKFDGLHKGHVQIIKKVVKEAKKLGAASLIFAFSNRPFSEKRDGGDKFLLTAEEKERLFRELGVDILLEYSFNNEFMQLSPEDFVKSILIDRLHVKYISTGQDFTFGNAAAGNCGTLKGFAKKYGFVYEAVGPLKIDGKLVSSSDIRAEVKAGDVKDAARKLGYNFFVDGVVSHGKRLGRTIGFPTINIYPPKEKLLPEFGVYLCDVVIKGERFAALTNVGIRPTVDDEDKVSVEAYIFEEGFNKDLYGEQVTVEFKKFIRREKKFSSVEALKEGIRKDLAGIV